MAGRASPDERIEAGPLRALGIIRYHSLDAGTSIWTPDLDLLNRPATCSETTVNFTFITEKPTRSEIEREMKGILEELF